MALTHDDRVKGAHAAVAARKRNQAELQRIAGSVWRIADGFQREKLPERLLAASESLVERVLTSDVECNTAGDVRALTESASTLHKMARLELGESTSNAASLSGNVDGLADVLRARAAQLDDVPTLPTVPPIDAPPT